MPPVVRGTGAVNSGTGTIVLAEPAGTADNDLQLMFLECDGAESATCSGWAHTPSSPQVADTASATDTKLSILYRIRSGAGTLTTNDPGDHITGRIMNILGGTFNASNPFNTSAGGTDLTEDTSGSCPGAITTIKNCLIVIAASSGFDPAVNGTTEYSGFTNANLTGIVEQIDNIRTSGNGGGIGVATGLYAGPGDYGSTTFTNANATLKAMISLAIEPAPPTALASREMQFMMMAQAGLRKMKRSMGGTVQPTPASTFKPQIIRWN